MAIAPAGSAGTVNVTVTSPYGTSVDESYNEFTYEDTPAVTSISPSVGPLSGSTVVTITGSNFADPAANSGLPSVYFGTQKATSFVSHSATQITVHAPPGNAGTVDITVNTTGGGTSATSSADQFTYVPIPAVTAVSPSAGALAGGTPVTITGSNLASASAVNFGGQAVTSFVSDSATQIVVNNPAASAGTVDITVTTPGGTSAVSGADEFTFGAGAAPTVSAVSPSSGTPRGGTQVTITGTNFAGIPEVFFGATQGTLVSASTTQIVAVSPAGSAGSVDVTVMTANGTSDNSSADKFTYNAPPAITSVSPATGPMSGGTLLYISGTGFTGFTAVTIGTTTLPAGNSVGLNGYGQIVVESTPVASTAGPVNITVTTPNGTSTVTTADQFTYFAQPVVTTVSLTSYSSSTAVSGPIAGGTTVYIQGGNLANATSVLFGNVPATITDDTGSEITVTSPPGAAGAVDVTVTTAAGTSATSSSDKFTYAAPPTVTSVSPSTVSGPYVSVTLTITGTNLANATSIINGSYSFGNFVSDTATQIVLNNVYWNITAGTEDVTVTTAGGTSALSAGDEVTIGGGAKPTIGTISPASGAFAGGTTVTITGTNFAGTPTVQFGNTSGTVISSSATQIVATAPAGTGSVDVMVATTLGTSSTTSSDHYTYVPAPVVSSLSTSIGATTGHSRVIIQGTNLAGASAIDFGSSAGTIVSDTATQIVAFSPTGTGTVDVTVTTPGGASATSSADQFTYSLAPVVSGITPTAGSDAGGTLVTITGTDLGNATSVNFGPHSVNDFISDSATQIVVASPPGTMGSVDVTVTTTGGTSATSSADKLTYVAGPAITGIGPAAMGPAGGGTWILITGVELANATAVEFGSNPGTIISDSTTQIVAVSPAGSGTADVTVQTVNGTSPSSHVDQFTYVPLPAVTSLAPATGPAAGGTTVTITGSNLENATEVLFGSAVLTSFVSDAASQLVVDSPAGSAGTVDIQVVTVGGTSVPSLGDQFTYGDGASPAVASVSPSVGALAGGATVTISGTNFAGTPTVEFGTSAATVVSFSTTQIIAVAPEGTGTVDISVTAAGGTSATSSADQFTYLTAPTLQVIAPAAGPVAGGTTVTITGTNLGTADSTTVDFGANNPGTIVSDDGSTLVVITPAGTAGPVDVTLTTAAGTTPTSAADLFTYIPPLILATISPATGYTDGGLSVTITGTNLGTASSVTVDFGTRHPGTIVSDNGSTIVVTSPAASAGKVDVTITTSGGTSAISASDQFTYIAAQSPAFSTANSVVVPVGEKGSFTIKTTSSPIAALSLTDGALPAGLGFNDNGDGTAAISGTAGSTVGTYTFDIVANNGFSAPVIQVFTLTVIDPPVFTSANSENIDFGKSPAFTVKTNAGLPVKTKLTYSGTLPAGVTFHDSGNGTATLGGKAATAGSFPITLTASNGTGSSTSQTFTLTVNGAPAFTSAATASFAVGTYSTFTINTTGFPYPSITQQGSLPGGLQFHDNGNGTATLSGMPTASGTVTLTLAASNNLGQAKPQTLVVTVAQPPSFTAGPSGATFQVGGKNSPVSFAATSSFPTAIKLSYSGNLPAGVTFTPTAKGSATLGGKPIAASGGTYRITITATNAVGSQTSETFTLTVNEAPSIISAATTTFVEGQFNSFTVKTLGFPRPAISASPNLPDSLTFHDNGDGTATLSGTPGSATTLTLSLAATNQLGSAKSQTFTLKLVKPSTTTKPPAITSGSSATFVMGQDDTFTIKTTGSPSVTSISVKGTLPPGVTLSDNNNGTATLNGIAEASSNARYTFTIEAANGTVMTAMHTFTLTVDRPVAITSTDTTIFMAGANNSFTIATTGSPAPTVVVSGALPKGVTLVDNKGVYSLAGKPPAGTHGTFSLLVTASDGFADSFQSLMLNVQ